MRSQTFKTSYNHYLKQLLIFAKYVFNKFKLIYAILAITAVNILLEYATASLMVPMAKTQQADSLVINFWLHISDFLELPPNFRTWLWLFILLMIARLAMGYVLNIFTFTLGKIVHKDLSDSIFGHVLLDEPMNNVYTRSIGHYIGLAGDDTFKSGTIISSALNVLGGFLTSTVGFIVLYQFSAILFFSMLGFLIISLLFMIFIMLRLTKLNARATELSRSAGTTFVEALNGLRSIRVLRAEIYMMSRYAMLMKDYISSLIKMDTLKAGIKNYPGIALLIVAAIILRPGIDTAVTNTEMLAGTFIIIRILTALGQVASNCSQLLTDIRSLKDINLLIAFAKEKDIDPPKINSYKKIKCISMQNLSFEYESDKLVLSDVNLSFTIGKTYAIVGSSGSGKSTLADILLGLSSPSSGAILINEDCTNLSAYKEKIALVEQSPKIFSSNIRDNLLLGLIVDEITLNKAIEAACLTKMINDLDGKLDTPITYLGENLSGGQRQRIGIARALLRRPDILILDEATSALDPQTRSEVVHNLRKIMQDGIIIFITHDPEIASLADITILIDSSKK